MNKGQLSLEQMIFIRNNIDNTTTCDYLGRVMGVDAHIIRSFAKEYKLPIPLRIQQELIKTEKKDLLFSQKELKKRGRPEIKKVARLDRRRFLFIMNEIGVCFKRFKPDKDDAVDNMVVIKQLYNEHSKSQRPKAEYTQSKSPYGIANELHGVKIR